MDLGIAPTPVVAYITKKIRAQLGVVISASHNPANYNGIKLVDSNGLRLQPDIEKQIEEQLINSKIELDNNLKKRRRKIHRQKAVSVNRYITDHIRKLKHNSLRGLKLVIDCSNGAIARTGERLLTGLGAEVISINDDMTGRKKINENCGSEFYRRYPEKLIKIVRKNKYDYGLSFDGDGDRVVVVDEKGNFYNGDDLIFILAVYLWKGGNLRNNTVVSTGNANSGLKKSLGKLGIKISKTFNGDKNLEAEMWDKKNNYLLGGEQVGNIIINDGEHGAADSLYAISLIFALLLSEETALPRKALLKENTTALNKWPQVLATVHMTKMIPQKDISRIKKEIKNNRRLRHNIRVEAWYSSTEAGLFNVMIEGEESENKDLISALAEKFCLKVLGLVQEKPSIFDLSTRKRL